VSAVDRLFGLKLCTKLKCEETGEEFEVRLWLQLQLRHISPGHSSDVTLPLYDSQTTASAAAMQGSRADLCCSTQRYLPSVQQDSRFQHASLQHHTDMLPLH
jgi:hypothetical protein